MENEEEFRPKYVEFLTDLMYSRCTDRFAKILANHSVPTYEYSFEYRGQYSIVNLQGEQVSCQLAQPDTFPGIINDNLISLNTPLLMCVMARLIWVSLTVMIFSTSSMASGERS